MANKANRQFISISKLEILAFLLVALIITVFLVRKGQTVMPSQAASDVKIYLNAGSAILTSTKTIDVMIDTRGKQITFSNIVLKFDPNLMRLTTEGVTPSDKLKNVITKSTSTEASNGQITLTLAARSEDMQSLPSGVFQLARFQVSKNSSVTQSNLSSSMTIDTAMTQVVDSTARNMSLEVVPLIFSVNPTSTVPSPAATSMATPVATTPSSTTYRVMLKNIPNPTTVADLFELNYIKIGSRTYQETDPFLTFSDKWTTSTTAKYTTNTAWVTFPTTEASILLGTSRAFNRGTVEVYVNDVLKQTLVLTQEKVEPYEVQINLR